MYRFSSYSGERISHSSSSKYYCVDGAAANKFMHNFEVTNGMRGGIGAEDGDMNFNNFNEDDHSIDPPKYAIETKEK